MGVRLKNRRIANLSTTIACIVFAHMACTGVPSAKATQEVPMGLLVPTDATDLRVRHRDGAADVVYKLRRPFPADALMKEISSTLSIAGFSPIPMDWMNPTMPSGHSRGWVAFVDGTVTPNVSVHGWTAQWQDASGNVVLYQLQYRSPLDERYGPAKVPDNDRLTVTAGWIPADMAKSLMAGPSRSEVRQQD